MSNVNLFILISAASLIMSLNGLSISIFIAFLMGSLGKKHQPAKIFIKGFWYLLAYFGTIAIVGLTATCLLACLAPSKTKLISLYIASLAILVGIVFVKYYFWNKKPVLTSKKIQGWLHTHTVKSDTTSSDIKLGAAAGLLSLKLIGAPLLCLVALIALLAPDSPQWVLLVAVYLVLPIKFIYLLILKKYHLSLILSWKNQRSLAVILSIGLLSIGLGWLILLVLTGAIGSI